MLKIHQLCDRLIDSLLCSAREFDEGPIVAFTFFLTLCIEDVSIKVLGFGSLHACVAFENFLVT